MPCAGVRGSNLKQAFQADRCTVTEPDPIS